MPYNDAILNEADRQKVQALKDQWQQFHDAGNTEAANNAHAQAEAIRSKYGYTGGSDGSGYKQTGANTMGYGDSILSEDDKARIDALGQQWRHYTALGDTESANAAHDQAESIRAKYGYSGGADGGGYKIVGINTQLRSAKPQDEAINAAIDARIAADQAALEAAQNQKMLDYEKAERELAPVYNTQRQNTASQYQIAARNMAERFNALGLGSGANGQMQLSRQNEYLRNMNALNAAEAKARADLEFERTKSRAAYQDAVAQAIREGDAAKARALYEEAIRLDNSLVSTSANQMTVDLQREATQWNRLAEQADNLAKFGDFSGYKALGYSDAEIAGMRKVWEAQNADLMALMGYGSFSGGGAAGSSGGGGSRSGSGSGSGNGGNGGSGSGKVTAGTKKGTQQYIGTQGQSSKTSFSYSPDEGIYTWNGKNYTNVASLKAALNKTALTDAEAAAIEKKFHASTGGTLGLH